MKLCFALWYRELILSEGGQLLTEEGKVGLGMCSSIKYFTLGEFILTVLRQLLLLHGAQEHVPRWQVPPADLRDT